MSSLLGRLLNRDTHARSPLHITDDDSDLSHRSPRGVAMNSYRQLDGSPAVPANGGDTGHMIDDGVSVSSRDRSMSADLSALPSSPRYEARRPQDGPRGRLPSLWGSLERQLMARLGRRLQIRVFGAFVVTLVLEGINFVVLAFTADLDKKENGCGTLTIVACSLIMVLQLLVIVMTVHHLVTRSWVVKLRDAWMLYFTTTLTFTGAPPPPPPPLRAYTTAALRWQHTPRRCDRWCHRDAATGSGAARSCVWEPRFHAPLRPHDACCSACRYLRAAVGRGPQRHHA